MDAVSSLSVPDANASLGWRASPFHLIVGMTLLALALRLLGVSSRPLWLDEAYTLFFSSRGWHELWTVVPTYETHPPFYYSLVKLWRGLFGESAVALRSLSILFSLAAVPIVAAASFELERQRPTKRPLLRAGIAAFLVAASPMLVVLGGEARPYPLLIFAYAVATLGLLRLMREFRDNGAGGPGSWLLLVVGTELGLWAHGLGVLYALCLGAALLPAWVNGRTRDRLIRGIGAAAIIALLYLPCLLIIARRAGDWGTGWLSWRPDMLLQLVGLYTVPVEVLNISSAFAALTIVLLAKRAIQSAASGMSWNADRAILLLWLGPPVLAALVSQVAMPIFLPRTLAATLVPAYLALGSALAAIEQRRERLVLSATLLVTLLPSAVQIAVRASNEQWKEVAAYLRQHVAPGDEVWLYPNDSALPLRAAGAAMPMRGLPGDYPAIGYDGPIRAGSPAVVSLTSADAVAIASNRRNARVVWLVARQSGIFDPEGDMTHALARTRRPGPSQVWGYIEVRPYFRR
ncbi:MAG: hypothetical protein ACJ8EP_08480 [Sphingomicrobium sp.]